MTDQKITYQMDDEPEGKITYQMDDDEPQKPKTGISKYFDTDDAIRKAGIAGRGIIKDIYSTAGIVTDPLAYASNKILGTNIASARSGGEMLADKLGLPKAETNAEKLGEAVSGSVGSSLTTMGVGNTIKATSGTLGAIRKYLTSNPGSQITSAATGSSSAELARQGGASEGGQIVAGLAGGLAPNAIKALKAGKDNLVKRAIRGNDQEGLTNYNERRKALAEAGVNNPTVGLASGNKVIQGMENIESTRPGSIRIADDARKRIEDPIKNRLAEIANNTSKERGTFTSGRKIKEDLSNFYDEKIQPKFSELNDNFMEKIPQEFPNGQPRQYRVDNTRSSLNRSASIDPNAPSLSAGFVPSKISSIRSRLESDLARPGGQFNTGRFTTDVVPQPIMERGLPVPSLRNLRTNVGKDLADKNIKGTIEDRPLRRLYGAISEDVRGAAKETDLSVGPQINNKGPLERSFERSNNYYSSATNRIKKLQPFANPSTPEEVIYNNVIKAAGRDVSTQRAVLKSVSGDTKASVAGTWIEGLGLDQNMAGDAWSFNTLMTNWNKLTPQGRSALTSGFKGSEKVAKDLDAVIKAAEMVRDGSKYLANPSGTDVRSGFKEALDFIYKPLISSTSMITRNQVSKKLMADPAFVSWLAEPMKKPDLNITQHLMRLNVIANNSKDPQFKKDVEDYQKSLRGDEDSSEP